MDQTPMPFPTPHAHATSTQPPPIPMLTKRKKTSRPVALVVVALVALVAAGAAAMLWQAQGLLHEKLQAASAKAAELSKAKQAAEARASAAEARSRSTDAELEKARGELGSTRQELSALQQEAASADAQMQELQQMAARFQRMIDSGKLKITLRRGRMVVDLPAQVLFPSGSAELSDEGKQSLREVARILRSVQGKRFIVGGHTDTKKLTKQAPFSSNWALSAARAVTVTEAMVRSGLRADQLVAAGYGPHDPVANNRTEAGRQENRRIEIILEPQVRTLPKTQ